MSANEAFSNPSSWLSTSRYLNRLFSQLEKYKNIKTILYKVTKIKGNVWKPKLILAGIILVT